MSIIKVDYGEIGGANLSYDSVTKSQNQSLQIKTENCMVGVHNGVVGARSIMQALVYNGNLEYGEVSSYGTITYNSATKILEITGTSSGVTSFLMEIFGDYEIVA